MALRRTAFRLLALARLGTLPCDAAGQITAVPAEGNTILAEADVDLPGGTATTTVVSDVPVSVLRYSDSGRFLVGQQPVPEGTAKILVTSDCNSTETDVVPSITSKDGTISVSVGVPEDASSSSTDYLAPSSFSAFWAYVSGFCPSLGGGSVVVGEGGDVLACQGVDEDACGENQFCKLAIGDCGAAKKRDRILDVLPDEFIIDAIPLPVGGSCEERPQICTTIYAPVCGCDGTTYGSECSAHAAGVNVASEGECASDLGKQELDPTSCKDSSVCETGDFCQLDAGVCSPTTSDLSGTCQAVPEICTTIYDPVCGCDGTTYGSECSAHGAGVNVDYAGECTDGNIEDQGTDPGASCEDSSMCPTGQFCQLGDGACGSTSAEQGTCLMTPEVCATIYDPVCGCDGITYSSRCNAHAVGANVDYPGECSGASPVLYECVDSSSCGSREFCQVDVGVCAPSAPNEGGVCKAKPETCTFDFTPVCGCDGTSYGNECAAHAAGINVDYVGECSSDETTTTSTGGGAEVLSTCSDDGDCGAEEFCLLATTVCEASLEQGGTCQGKPEVCAMIYSPVCGCDGITYSSGCDAHALGVNVASEGECANQVKPGDCVEEGFCLDPNGVCSPQANCLVDPCQADPNACAPDEVCTANYCGGCYTECVSDPELFNDMEGPTTPATVLAVAETSLPSELPPGNASKGPSKGPTIAPTSMSTIEPPTNSPIVDATTGTAVPEMTTAATTTASATEPASTEEVSTPGTTSATITESMSTATSDTTTGDVESNPPSQSPTRWWQKAEEGGTPTASSAFDRPHSFSFQAWTLLMAIAIVSILLPINNSNSAIGIIFVAAAAASTFYSRGRNIRRADAKRSAPSLVQQERMLDICTFNVEVLYDGCNNDLEIVAPSARVIDVAIEDVVSQKSEEDPCATDYEGELTFPATNSTADLNLPTNGSVPSFEPYSTECLKAVEGRPFVDATGGSLQATPWVASSANECALSALSWTSEVEAKNALNATGEGWLVLGEDWTRRALGEHASVASFSAFSIALMTNQAPSALVNDALRAGLDEVRHAKMSFEIASKLVGKEVGPGPLPESKLEFGQDLEALALAVAREGCVDETLSAFAAAVEADHIADVMENGSTSSPYLGIDGDLLDFIKKELVTIAMDESNHAALAWRTLSWVCSVDSSVCDAVNEKVFEETSLESRFRSRAGASFGDTDVVSQQMRNDWMKIFDAHVKVRNGEEVAKLCSVGNVKADGDSVVVVDTIVHLILCG